jgi:hypothetical protein
MISKKFFYLPRAMRTTTLTDLKNRLGEKSSAAVISAAIELTVNRLNDEPAMFFAQLEEFIKVYEPPEPNPIEVKLSDETVEDIEVIMHAVDTEDACEAVAFAIWHADQSIGIDPLVGQNADGSWFMDAPRVHIEPSIPPRPKGKPRFGVITGGKLGDK